VGARRVLFCLIVGCVLVAAVGGAVRPGHADPGVPDKVILLLGDANMLGRGQPLSDGETPDPNLLLWRGGTWQEASDPLGDPADPSNGVGLGMTFGLDALADGAASTIGLIQCAGPDQAMKTLSKSGQFKACLRDAHAATSHVDGALVLEGTADARKSGWAKSWASGFGVVKTAVRSSFGATVPFVVAQIGDLSPTTYTSVGLLRSKQQAVASTDDGVSVVATLDLPLGPDGSSFTVDGYKQLGQRMEQSWLATSADWHLPDEVFILAGQSNMSGRGKPINKGTRNTDHHLVAWQNGAWQIATDPLQGPDTESGVGPGMTFGLQVMQYEPGKTIGLILCSVGGTTMSQWLPGGSLYQYCVNQALATGRPLGGMLFLQGESDIKPIEAAESWESKFNVMLGAFRDQFGPDVPFVLGQIGALGHDAAIVQQQQAQAAADNPNVALVVTADLPIDRSGHFPISSYKIIGRRFGDAWWSLAQPPPPPPPPGP
jgi:hypothetical protein